LAFNPQSKSSGGEKESELGTCNAEKRVAEEEKRGKRLEVHDRMARLGNVRISIGERAKKHTL